MFWVNLFHYLLYFYCNIPINYTSVLMKTKMIVLNISHANGATQIIAKLNKTKTFIQNNKS